MADNVRESAGRNFRLPSAAKSPPPNRHLAWICAWAATIALVGIFVAFRAFIVLIYEERGWFLPVLLLIGLAGMASTIGALASVQRRRLPMILLGIASATIVAAWIVTGL
jgi:hypothetical protein